MTKDEILDMPAGRDMDALISVKVFKRLPSFALDNYPPFSTEITSAISIIDEMEGEIKRFSTHKYEGGYGVFLNSDFEVTAKTLPLALCRAALLWASSI